MQARATPEVGDDRAPAYRRGRELLGAVEEPRRPAVAPLLGAAPRRPRSSARPPPYHRRMAARRDERRDSDRRRTSPRRSPSSSPPRRRRRSRCRAATPRAPATSCSRPPTSTGARSRCSSATSAGSPSTIPSRTRAWPASRSSTRSSRRDPFDAPGRRHDRGGRDRLRALLRDAPPIDLVHLGLGPDGHTASLFPGSAALDEDHHFVVVNGDDAHPHPRLTFTFPALAQPGSSCSPSPARRRREAFARVRAGDDVPAARVQAARVIWLVDPPRPAVD